MDSIKMCLYFDTSRNRHNHTANDNNSQIGGECGKHTSKDTDA